MNFQQILPTVLLAVFENLMMQVKEVSNTNGMNEWWLGSGGLDFITLRYLIVVQDYLMGFLVFVAVLRIRIRNTVKKGNY